MDNLSPGFDTNNKLFLTSYQNIELDLPKKELDRARQIELQVLLTQRETEVLRLLAQGQTNPEIAGQLCISPHTVKSHVCHIYEKLQVNDRTQAAVLAINYKLI